MKWRGGAVGDGSQDSSRKAPVLQGVSAERLCAAAFLSCGWAEAAAQVATSLLTVQRVRVPISDPSEWESAGLPMPLWSLSPLPYHATEVVLTRAGLYGKRKIKKAFCICDIIFLSGAYVSTIIHVIYITQEARLYDHSNSFRLYSVWKAESTYIKLHFISAIVKVSLGIGRKNLEHDLRTTKKWSFWEHY